MSLQQQILIGFTILSLGIIAIFTWVALSTRVPALSPAAVTELDCGNNRCGDGICAAFGYGVLAHLLVIGLDKDFMKLVGVTTLAVLFVVVGAGIRLGGLV